MFLEVMSELSFEEQKDFLLFITGAARLPYGGFRVLRPKLTIVKKTS